MRRLLSIHLILIYATIFIGCSSSTESIETKNISPVGKWIFFDQTYSEEMDGQIVINRRGAYNPALDEYYHTSIIEITNDKKIDYSNIIMESFYHSDTVDILIDQGSIIIFPGDDKRDKYTMNWSIENNLLELTFPDGTWGNKIYWYKYDGEFPPRNWIDPFINDKYEPDSSYQISTQITIGENFQNHRITLGDYDYFHFHAEKDKKYIIRVLGYMDNVLILYESDGRTKIDEDDDNEKHIDVGYNVESVIVWDCTNTDIYFFLVRAYYHPYTQGYYAVDVNLIE